MRRLMLLIRTRYGNFHHDSGRERGQMEVLQSIIDEYGGDMRRIPKRVRRAWITIGSAQ